MKRIKPRQGELPSGNWSGPHGFRPIGLRDRLRPFAGRCQHCYLPRDGHPVPDGFYTIARPWGSKVPAMKPPIPDGVVIRRVTT